MRATAFRRPRHGRHASVPVPGAGRRVRPGHGPGAGNKKPACAGFFVSNRGAQERTGAL